MISKANLRRYLGEFPVLEALYEAKQQGRNRVVFKNADDAEVETGNFRVRAGIRV